MTVIFTFLLCSIVISLFYLTQFINGDERNGFSILMRRNIQKNPNIYIFNGGLLLISITILSLVFGYSWTTPLYLSITLGICTIITFILGLFQYTYNRSDYNFDVYFEPIMIMNFFLGGLFLYTLREFIISTYGDIIGISLQSIMNIWFILSITSSYYFRAKWSMVLSAVLGTISILIDLAMEFIFVSSVTIDLKMYIGQDSHQFNVIRILIVLILSCIYTVSTSRTYDESQSHYNIFHNIIEMMMLIYLGNVILMTKALVYSSEMGVNYNGFGNTHLLLLVSLGLFGLDQYLSRMFKSYHITQLIPISIIVSLVLASIVLPHNIFYGFHYLEVVFIGLLTALLLRHDNLVAQLVFYIMCTFQIWSLSISQSVGSWETLIITISLLGYGVYNYRDNMIFGTYTLFISICAISIKVFGLNTAAASTIVIAGCLCVLGYLISSSKLITSLTTDKK